MIPTPQTFLIVILIIIPPVSEFVIVLTVILHTMYLSRQEVDQTFVTTCKSMIDFINLLINKRYKCVSFYNIFCKFDNNLCYISLTQLVSVPLDKPQLLLGVAPKSSNIANKQVILNISKYHFQKIHRHLTSLKAVLW